MTLRSTTGANAAGKTHTVANLQYDALGHMTRADGWWGTGTFEYDGFGNLGRRWLSETGANPRRIWNFYDANNRLFVTDDSLPTASGGASWHSHSYDDRGNITRSGSSANNQHTMFMTYDMSDQMVGMSGHNLQEAPLTASYQYNGAGKRVYTNHNGRQSYPMYDAGGALRSVYKVHDGELVEQIALQNGHPLAKWTGSTLTYLHADHLGTPIRGTHGLGGTGLTPGAEVFQDFATPYGLNPTPQWHGNGGSGFDPATSQGSNCGVTGFTMHAKDCESGLTHMQARQYSPVSGRFLSIDPMTMMDMDMNPNYFNRYSYTFNDPINAIDPTGMYVEFSDRTSEEDLDKFTSYIAESDTATDQLNALSGAEEGYTIDISTENTHSDGSPRSYYDPNTRTAHINPEAGTKVQSGGVISAASGGVHEMAHAVQHLIAGSTSTFVSGQRPERSTADSKGNIIKRGVSPNERDATNVQNRSNREMGEPTRNNYYDGRRVRTCGGVTSRTPC